MEIICQSTDAMVEVVYELVQKGLGFKVEEQGAKWIITLNGSY